MKMVLLVAAFLLLWIAFVVWFLNALWSDTS